MANESFGSMGVAAILAHMSEGGIGVAEGGASEVLARMNPSVSPILPGPRGPRFV